MHNLLTTAQTCKNGPWCGNTRWRVQEPVTGLKLCMGIFFPVSGSYCAPLFCLILCITTPQAHSHISVFHPQGRGDVILQEGCTWASCPASASTAGAGEPSSHRGMTHTIRADLALSHQYVSKSVPSSVWMHYVFLGDSYTEMQWPEMFALIPSGWYVMTFVLHHGVWVQLWY